MKASTSARVGIADCVPSRVTASAAATWARVGCNTNLGILLLCAPIAAAVERAASPSDEAGLRRALAQQHGGVITPAAALLGLQWYAEPTTDAQAPPGKHPNIDRLVNWSQGTATFLVRPHNA